MMIPTIAKRNKQRANAQKISMPALPPKQTAAVG
jgi:hypothetical protein